MAFIAIMVICGMTKFIRFLCKETPTEDWYVGVAVAILVTIVLAWFLVLWFFHRTLPRIMKDWNRLKKDRKDRHNRKGWHVRIVSDDESGTPQGERT